MSHLDALNSAQRKAVETTEGPLLVLAGAGAGKTRVIAHRMLEIVRRSAAPEQILAITFTNKAASEMRERVLQLLHTERVAGDKPPHVSTFHSLGLLIIKENAKLLGFKRTPVVYDRADSLREMKAALKQFDESMEPRVALGIVSRAKGEGIVLGEFAGGARGYRDEIVAKAWARYDEALARDGALDFDDFLLRSMLLLKNNETLRRRYQERWRYAHVDEYQDTNVVQAELLALLVGPEKNVCAVGDIDQTIYGWRGAEIKNILSFEHVFPGTNIVTLEQNYRSTKHILEAANALIANNPNRPEKHLFTNKPGGEKLSLYAAGDGGDEARFITRTIEGLLAEGAQPRDCAVLYRANFQSRALEEKLLDARIPYQVLGTRFFERKEVKDALSFVRCAVSESAVDLGRVIDTLPGIGKVSKLKILAGQEAALAGKIGERVRAMRMLLAEVRDATLILPPSELMRMVIVESGMEHALKNDPAEGAERLENLRELVSLAARYDAMPRGSGLETFLESAALASDQDDLKREADAVRLMTVHAAKGLEFPYVFIVGLEEGLFPYVPDRREDEEHGIEEERRLMYVALTRGQKKIYLSWAMLRTVFGATDVRMPSSFLHELPQELIEIESPERLGKTIYLD